MKSTLEQVTEFHQFFGAPILETPEIPSEVRANLRLDLLSEELQELRDAVAAQDLVEVLDALTDIQYILDGTYLEFGLAKVKAVAFDEVHRSNMSKAGEDGKPLLRGDGKILKGPNYFKPELAKFIQGGE